METSEVGPELKSSSSIPTISRYLGNLSRNVLVPGQFPGHGQMVIIVWWKGYWAENDKIRVFWHCSVCAYARAHARVCVCTCDL